MSYEVWIVKRAQKELADVPRSEYDRVRDEIWALGDDARPRGCRKLTGREGWRIRAGGFRVIYEIDDKAQRVTVLHVGHRRDVYR